MTGNDTRRRNGLVALCLAAVLFAAGIGLGQTQAILQFRRPSVDQSLGPAESALVEGVRYRLSTFDHGARLPLKRSLRDPESGTVVEALPGAELVLVVLSVEIVTSGRLASTVFCDLSLTDESGRTWRGDGTIGYRVEAPENGSCSGGDPPPQPGQPYDVATVFQLPADAVDHVTVRARLSGGQVPWLLELRPR
ncbi:hypothetical protein GCM10022204_31100 [Microlunatus aurantiacus]|uniref:DUF4352 domain-containing protein n=1 Tax=Microlunatus aurantiacus TaxID=446786 RepID=A0ABP7DXH6_9ACTN